MKPSRFFDVCDVFDPKFGNFSTFATGLKVIQRFKAKMEVFSERKSSKVDNGSFLLPLTPNFLERDETSFSRFQSRNLAQTQTLGDISLDVIFEHLGNQP